MLKSLTLPAGASIIHWHFIKYGIVFASYIIDRIVPVDAVNFCGSPVHVSTTARVSAFDTHHTLHGSSSTVLTATAFRKRKSRNFIFHRIKFGANLSTKDFSVDEWPWEWDAVLPTTRQRRLSRLYPTKAGTRFSDPGWMKSWWVNLEGMKTTKSPKY